MKIIMLNNNSHIYSAEFLCFAQQRQLVDMREGCADASLKQSTYRSRTFYDEKVIYFVSLRQFQSKMIHCVQSRGLTHLNRSCTRVTLELHRCPS